MIDFPNSPTVDQIVTAPNGSAWKWNGSAWKMSSTSAFGPKGRVAYAQITANQGAITTNTPIVGLSVMWTADPSRTYRTTVYSPAIYSSVNGDMAIAYLGNQVSAQATLASLPMAAVLGHGHVLNMSVVQTGLSGVQTRYATLSRSLGTGSLVWVATPDAPSFILVEDITYEPGSSGGPSGSGSYTPLTLSGGVTNRGVSVAGYRMVGDEVQLRGLVDLAASTPASTVFATLPVGFRPPTWSVVLPMNPNVSNTVAANMFIVRTTGTIEVGVATTAGGGFVGLEVVRFSVTP